MEKEIIILGAGESGLGAAILAVKKGLSVFVSDAGPITDLNKKELESFGIEYEEGGHDEARVLAAEEIVKSPGIPEKAPLIKMIRAKGIRVISEIELAWRYAGDAKIIAITGSNGKTTTTALIGHLLRVNELDPAVVGNIGSSFARQVALDPKEFYVVEISSFQLDDIKTFRPYIAIMTNITADHLDRYNYNFLEYVDSKFRIIQNQTAQEHFIYNDDDPVIKEKLNSLSPNINLLPFAMNREIQKGSFIKNRMMTISTGTGKMEFDISDFLLLGKHNQYNSMAAGITGAVLGLRKEKIRSAMQPFESLEHRMENVGVVRGVTFINDSKATNVNSTWFALESMERPTVLILGGVDKGNDYSLLDEMVAEKVKAIVCLGKNNEKIHEAFGSKGFPILDTESAEEAVQTAFHLADKGDTVLLSPACASFDLFKNYEDRGTQFAQAVRNL